MRTADPDHEAEGWRLRCQQQSVLHAEAIDREVRAAARTAQLESELASERATVAEILASRSWKVTEPLRRLRGRTPVAQGAGEAMHDLFEARMQAAYDARASSWPQPEPTTLNEKIWHRRLADRRPVLQIYCDKQASWERAARVLPDDLMPERLAVVDGPDELRALTLPREYVVKARHASGGSAVVWDGPASDVQDWVHPWVRKAYCAVDAPLARVGEDLADCLGYDYGWEALEWGYLGVPRQLLVDRLYRGRDGDLPVDLRCYVFHGRVGVIEMATDRQRSTPRQASWHDRQWNLLPIANGTPHGPHDRPKELDEGIEVAEALAGDEEFLRVDMLITSEGLKFGELTAYPHGGNAPFATGWADEFLGSLW